VFESAVINAPVDQVYAALRALDFSFLKTVSRSEVDGKSQADEVGSTRTITYNDKTVQRVKLVELNDADRSITYELIESQPAISVLSAVHTWRLRRISHDNTTLFEFTSDYSKDASDQVIADSKYKKLELFKDLRDALARGLGKGGERKEEKKGGIGGQPGTQFERTFIAVKPDGVQRGLVGEIIGRFEKRGFKLVALKMTTPTKEKAEGHYADLAGRPFFPALVKFFSSGPIVGMVWEGRNAIQIGRQMLGATKPIESAPGSIRGDFGIDVGRNVCHGSDGPSGAQREIAFWFTPEEVSSWNNTIGVWIHE